MKKTFKNFIVTDTSWVVNPTNAIKVEHKENMIGKYLNSFFGEAFN